MVWFLRVFARVRAILVSMLAILDELVSSRVGKLRPQAYIVRETPMTTAHRSTSHRYHYLS